VIILFIAELSSYRRMMPNNIFQNKLVQW